MQCSTKTKADYLNSFESVQCVYEAKCKHDNYSLITIMSLSNPSFLILCNVRLALRSELRRVTWLHMTSLIITHLSPNIICGGL